MMKFAVLLGLVAVASGAIQKAANGEIIEDSYIVQFKSDVSDQEIAEHMTKVVESGGKIQHRYNGGIKGYAVAHPDQKAVAAFSEEEIIEVVEANQIARAYCDETETTLWGLLRVSTTQSSGGTKRKVSTSGGSGVDVYIIDTGIQTGHNEFGGRATFGFDCTGEGPGDGNGHGTHCASTAAGSQYGLATKSDVFAVKVLNRGGSGTFACVIAGIEYVGQQSGARVGSLSLGGGFSAAVNNAVDAAVNAGAAMISASGNSNANACNFSPASAPNGLGVNSIQSGDSRSSFSNFGTCTDMFAPGSNILGAWIGSDSASRSISGTSMACPHVTGIIAETWSANPSADAKGIQDMVVSQGQTGAVSNPGAGSPNVLAQTSCARAAK